MPAKTIQRISYTYNFIENQLRPIVETRVLLEDSNQLFSQYLSIEDITKKSEPEVLALSKTKKAGEKEETEKKTYVITYYNPELEKTETLTTTSEIKITDVAQSKIEEAIGARSGYEVYSFIAAPIITKEIKPYLLEQILNEREYDTPPKFGGAMMVRPRKVGSEIVKVQKEKTKESLVEAIERKEKVEKSLGEEILVFEQVIKEMRKGEASAIERLPALSRARYLALLKKKRVSLSLVMALLQKDASFLKSIKKKLENLSPRELVELIKVVKMLSFR